MIADRVARERDVATAEKLIGTIVRGLRMLSDHPRAGRSRDSDLGPGRRSIVLADHVVVYRVAASEALILRVLDGRRDLIRIFRG